MADGSIDITCGLVSITSLRKSLPKVKAGKAVNILAQSGVTGRYNATAVQKNNQIEWGGRRWRGRKEVEGEGGQGGVHKTNTTIYTFQWQSGLLAL